MTGILITVRIKLLFLADRLAWGRAWHKALALRCFWFGSDRNLTKRRSRRGCSKHTHRVPSGKVFYPGRCRLTKNGKHNKSGRYIKFVSYNMEFTLNSIDSVVSTTPTSPREGVGPFFFFFFRLPQLTLTLRGFILSPFHRQFIPKTMPYTGKFWQNLEMM